MRATLRSEKLHLLTTFFVKFKKKNSCSTKSGQLFNSDGAEIAVIELLYFSVCYKLADVGLCTSSFWFHCDRQAGSIFQKINIL